MPIAINMSELADRLDTLEGRMRSQTAMNEVLQKTLTEVMRAMRVEPSARFAETLERELALLKTSLMSSLLRDEDALSYFDNTVATMRRAALG
ncbi:MAG: hypothetical protein ACTHL8_01060 [Burkholderiaceae bacterium]